MAERRMKPPGGSSGTVKTAVATGSMLLNIIMIAIILGIVLVVIVFVKGGIVATQQAIREISQSIQNWSLF